jgi:hypothetical protein
LQSLATGFQVADVFSDGFVHRNKVAYQRTEHRSMVNNSIQAGVVPVNCGLGLLSRKHAGYIFN